MNTAKNAGSQYIMRPLLKVSSVQVVFSFKQLKASFCEKCDTRAWDISYFRSAEVNVSISLNW